MTNANLTAYVTVTKGVRFLNLPQLPMGDWDWPDAAHKVAGCITIRHLGDVVENFLEVKPLGNFQFYLTPGGVHAFNLGVRVAPKILFNRSNILKLNIDPFYRDLCIKHGVYPVRISPKWERLERAEPDWVALPLGTLSFGKLPNLETSVTELKELHDQAINLWLSANPKQLEAAKRVAAIQMATVPKAIQKLWGY